MIWVPNIVYRSRRLLARFAQDKRGLAAVEFAFILPLMLTLIFGTIEVSSAVAIDRKVTIAARTISDLVSQGAQVKDADLKNYFALGAVIMTPYPVTSTTLTQKISAINIDGSKIAKVAWSKIASVTGGVATVTDDTVATPSGTTVTSQIPPGLLVANTQLIWSSVTYTYAPIVKYVINSTGIPLSDQCFTRPRQSDTVAYAGS